MQRAFLPKMSKDLVGQMQRIVFKLNIHLFLWPLHFYSWPVFFFFFLDESRLGAQALSGIWSWLTNKKVFRKGYMLQQEFKTNTLTSVLLILFLKVLIESIRSYQIMFLGAVNPSAVSRSPPVSYLRVYFLMLMGWFGVSSSTRQWLFAVQTNPSLCCWDSKRLCWKRRNRGILIWLTWNQNSFYASQCSWTEKELWPHRSNCLGVGPNVLVLKVSHQNISKTESKDDSEGGKNTNKPKMKRSRTRCQMNFFHDKIW